MKRIFLLLIVLLATLSINAQVIKVYENGNLSASYTNSLTNAVKVVFEENATSKDVPADADSDKDAQSVKVYVNGVLIATYVNSPTNTVEVIFDDASEPEPTASNLLPGKFSVSETKQVQFTKANLYWDGNDFRLEANQTDYPTEWDANHVGHFMWGKTAASAYGEYFGETDCVASDKFFADGSDTSHMLTVDGTSDLYLLSSDEWCYLLEERPNVMDLYKCAVTVTNGETSYEDCIIIAPDDYDFTTTPLASSYTLDEVNKAGLVCLPAAGYRSGNTFFTGHSADYPYGLYWFATPVGVNDACYLEFSNRTSINPPFQITRSIGCSIRLAKDAEASEPGNLITSITLEPTELTLTTGDSFSLRANFEPVDADNQTLQWTSDNESVATVEGCIVTAVGPGTATITCAATDGSGVTATCVVTVVSADTPDTPTAGNLLPGKFTVGDGKQVQFTKANLYWDGNDFRFEANQTDYPTEWNTSHVGHFFWTSTAANAYAETNSISGSGTSTGSETSTGSGTSLSERFFADGSDAEHMLTVEGTDSLYALSSVEWMQLVNHAYDNNLIKGLVVVTNNDGQSFEGCVVIAPDDFKGEWKDSYTLEELNAEGLLCLPPAGYRDGSSIAVDNFGYYWAGQRALGLDNYFECMYFNLDGKIDPMYAQPYLYGSSIRLVKDAEASESGTAQLVTAITVMPSSLTLSAGVSAMLMATVEPADADNQTLSWSSSDESVATVVDGEVTAVAPGTATITATATDGSGVSGTSVITVTSADVPTVTGDNLLPGKFSVSATKKVQFTKANLYWNGSDFRFEANQTDYPTEWNESHVGHFLWTSLTDLQSGNASMPFDEELAYSNPSASDRMWCGEDNPLNVEGTDSLYVLSGMLLSAPDQYNEWRYLMQERTNASNLCKLGVTVTNGEDIHTNCLIIAPDDFAGTLQSSYTLDEVNVAGLVCLPAAGYRDGQMLVGGDKLGLYWSSTPDENDLQFANCLCFDRETLMSADFLDHGIFGYDGFRKIGHAIRLAKLAEVSEPTTEPETDPTTTGDNLLSGKFTVADGKQVQFTKGNLYWDGNDFKLEANQTDYQTEWDEKHVGYFYWNCATDYQPGSAYCLPYAEDYTYSNMSTSDKFWCGEDNPLTIDGTSGLYALTGGDGGEWQYLMQERTNASSLYKYGVAVTNGENVYENCLIIAPDNFTGELQSSYTLDEVNAAGLVCLPAAGSRYGTTVTADGSDGNYWSSTPDLDESFNAFGLNFTSGGALTVFSSGRYFALSIRLVKDAEASEPEEETSQLVTSITVTPSTLMLPVGSTALLSATVSPSNATNQYLRWSSSDESIVAVYDSIIVTKAVGTATITATATDGSGVTATCTIIVYNPDANDNSGSIDGRDYVDLGLPSGTMWATCNVGATSPEGYGEYFAWGETTGSSSGKTVFDWEQYKLCNNGEADQLNKYCTNSKFGTVDGKTELDVEDDAAYVNWGSNWRMPSLDQINEMRENCTWTWTTLNSVNGYTVTGTNGNSIFLPAAGMGSYTGEAYGMGTDGGYWTRTLNLEGYSDYAYHYGFTSDYIGNETACRFCGYSIRPVLNTEK